MTKNISYDFNFLKNQSQDEQENAEQETVEQEKQPLRPDYRIIRCCGNCKFFWYEPGKDRRGYCRGPIAKESAINTKAGEKYNVNHIKANWLHSHTTNICDLHKFQSKWRSIGTVSEWVGIIFNPDGSLSNEEDI